MRLESCLSFISFFIKFIFLLGNNFLTGSIPNFHKLKNLREIFLVGNNLSGSIFSEIFLLPYLEYFVVHDNLLTGTIPNQVTRQNLLKYLNIQNNHINGTIPSQIYNLENLEILDLSTNELTGQVPTDLMKLHKLRVIQLQFNYITGTIPSQYCSRFDILAVDCKASQGVLQVSCECCSCFSGIPSETHISNLHSLVFFVVVVVLGVLFYLKSSIFTVQTDRYSSENINILKLR